MLNLIIQSLVLTERGFITLGRILGIFKLLFSMRNLVQLNLVAEPGYGFPGFWLGGTA